MEKNKDNQEEKNKLDFIRILIILLIIIGIVSMSMFAYAKYISKIDSNTTAQVAKWSFKLVDGIAETKDITDFYITRTDNNPAVEQEKIAPRNIWKI